MHFAAVVMLASTLVLRSGDRITIDGPATQQDGIVVFRSGGALYSVPVSNVDAKATAEANQPAASQKAPGKLKVSPAERDRLLRELENNHTGQPPREQRWEATAPVRAADLPPEENSSEEWQWRSNARSYEEAVENARENLQLLRDRAERLRDEIRGFLSLGYRPNSFTYQTTQLVTTEEQIPRAELEVKRAQRAWDQFRDDARRRGIMPGWLR